MALKSILKGAQQVLLRSGMIARKTQNLLLRISAFFNSLAVLAILSRELNR